MRKSLDMIGKFTGGLALHTYVASDEEKENYQEIIDRVAKLEKLARFCDQNDW